MIIFLIYFNIKNILKNILKILLYLAMGKKDLKKYLIGWGIISGVVVLSFYLYYKKSNV